MHRFALLGLGSYAIILAFLGCKEKRLPHGGEEPLYELRGLHAAVACADCHGPGTPKSLSRLCIDCHELDRPAPDHNPGQECGSCHNELPPAWLNGATPLPTGDTGVIVPTGETGIEVIPDPIHDNLASGQLCWDCHKDEERKDENHYANPANPQRNWDCGSCHDTGPTGTGWLQNAIVHPVRTPHGTYFQNDPVEELTGRWVVACEACHTTITGAPNDDYTQFECSSCHDLAGALPAQVDIFAPQHYGYDPGPETDQECLCCHEFGDIEYPETPCP
jgi:hypothetical protein